MPIPSRRPSASRTCSWSYPVRPVLPGTTPRRSCRLSRASLRPSCRAGRSAWGAIEPTLGVELHDLVKELDALLNARLHSPKLLEVISTGLAVCRGMEEFE